MRKSKPKILPSPGPWRVTRQGEVVSSKGYICCCGDQDRKANAVDRANARLISAAPESLQALKLAEVIIQGAARGESVNEAIMTSDVLARIDRAIGKAEGTL